MEHTVNIPTPASIPEELRVTCDHCHGHGEIIVPHRTGNPELEGVYECGMCNGLGWLVSTPDGDACFADHVYTLGRNAGMSDPAIAWTTGQVPF